MHSAHTFDIKSTKSQAICNGGSRTIANSDNFPILRGMATYSLKLDRGSIREPHWHPNAAELSYCLSGKALMTIFGHGATHNQLLPILLSPLFSLNQIVEFGIYYYQHFWIKKAEMSYL
jgi:oxalate decarboxylase/phosphoglucose isomerase-like protein (cupin superfamily)